MNILFAFIVIAVLGLLLGAGLAFADKKLKVEKDEKLVQLEGSMPGANCGGCGFAGCAAYAEAVYKGIAKPGLCSPGGSALAKKMGEIMGVEVAETERMVAYVFCRGGKDRTREEYEYKGIQDCNAAALLFGGPQGCKEGCLHLGSCMAACKSGAISRDENGDLVVDKEKCIGCQACTKVCPNHVIKMVPYSAEYVVACNNHEAGAKAKKNCSVACIGCKICQVKVENSPFTVENFLSTNDYSKDQTNAAAACEKCPQKCIVRR
ncbi:MAG: RnfABCDGE type electron transport complex subunit B [Spirochaetales bacterium]|nr:RnfABCDGE type electron transport complex subunit B [Candidatus Physcosoma equi]